MIGVYKIMNDVVIVDRNIHIIISQNVRTMLQFSVISEIDEGQGKEAAYIINTV